MDSTARTDILGAAVLLLQRLFPSLSTESLEAAIVSYLARLQGPQDDGTAPPPKRFLGYEQASEYTGLSACTLWRCVRDRRLPVCKIGARCLFEIDDLDHLLMSHKSGNGGDQ